MAPQCRSSSTSTSTSNSNSDSVSEPSRIRKRPVSFGNPALGTYHGTVFTLESPAAGRDAVPGAQPVDRMAAMVDIPPEQVPEGVLNVVRSHSPFILHVRIVIAERPPTPLEEISKREAPAQEPNTENASKQNTKSSLPLHAEEGAILTPAASPVVSSSAGVSVAESAASILAADDALEAQRQLDKTSTTAPILTAKRKESICEEPPDPTVGAIDALAIAQEQKQQLSRTYVVLFEFRYQDDADAFARDLHGKPYTSLDETETCSVYTVLALQGQDNVSLMSPFFAPSTKPTPTGKLQILPPTATSSASASGITSASTKAKSKKSSESKPTSKVLSSPKVATKKTASSSASGNSASSDEQQNCPVCLDRMILDPTTVVPANNSDEAAQASILTTVCNHTFHLHCLLRWQDSPCPVCRYDHSGLNEALSQCHICNVTQHNYVCLICGVVSCADVTSSRARARASCSEALEGVTSTALQEATAAELRAGSHARQHYDDTLHAYALDTETQHVWDFAGQGYVHRLLQNKEDGKLVEVHDPNSTSQERMLSPGLSEAQEDEVVHRKLEGFASQYYTLLKSQLEQQRIFYEGRLEEIRREFDANRIREASRPTRTHDLISALRQERKQLSQRHSALQKRCDKVNKDVSFLKSMNESLQSNKVSFQRKVAEAQRQSLESRNVLQTCIPPLEEKVNKLMLELEESMTGNAPSQDERKPKSNNRK